MTNIWKRSISMFLALVMVIGMLPVNAFATETGDQIVEETQVTEPVATEAPAETEATEATEVPAETEATEATEAPVETEATEVTEPAEETQPVEIVTGNVSAPAADSVAEETTEPTEAEESPAVTRRSGSAVPGISGLPSDEELFVAYANNVLHGNGAATLGTAAYDSLPEGNVKKAYDALKPILQDIAAGKRTSAEATIGHTLSYVENDTTYTMPVDKEVNFTGITFSNEEGTLLLDTLLADMPYDLYWFDKTIGFFWTYTWIGDQMQIKFSFVISESYSNGIPTEVTLWGLDENGAEISWTEEFYFSTDASITGAAANTVTNAQTVVADVAASSSVKTDYDKLLAYKDWICNAVEYDWDAAESGDYSADDNPWQLIHVFDNVSTTNVVCEGYSKAFQYLCDLTDWDQDITCYSVTGDLVGYGPHMWNIVTIGDASYMVDLTNSDYDDVNNELFLVGGTADANGVYTFERISATDTLSFDYDSDTESLWGNSGILNLSATDYEIPTGDGGDIDMGEEESETIIQQLQSELNAANGEFILDEDVTLSGELTIPEGVELAVNATVTVNNSLTINGSGALYVPEQGVINVTYGALTLSGNVITTIQGAVNVAGTAEIAVTQNAEVEVGTRGTLTAQSGAGYDNIIDEAIRVYLPNDKVTGFDKSNMKGIFVVETEEELQNAVQAFAEGGSASGYGAKEVAPYVSMALTENITIPENVCVYLHPWGNQSVDLIISDGVTLTNKGELEIESGELYIPNGGVMNVVGGTLNLVATGATIQGAVTIDSTSVLAVDESTWVEVGSKGKLLAETGANVENICNEAIRVFLPNGKVEGISKDLLWGTWLIETSDELKTALTAFSQDDSYKNYGFKEVSPYCSVELEENITIPADVWMQISNWEDEPVVITVPEGISLAVEGQVDINPDGAIKVFSGELYVPEGGIVNVSGGTLELREKTVATIQGTVTGYYGSIELYEDAQIEVGSKGELSVNSDANVSAQKGAVRVYLPNGKVDGIDKSNINGIYLVETAADLIAAAEAFAEGGSSCDYGIKELSPYVSMTLTNSVTIPADVWMYLFVREGNPVVLTIPKDVTLTNEGELTIESGCAIEIQSGGKLINNGHLMAEETSGIINNGTLEGETPEIQNDLEWLQAELNAASGEYWVNSRDLTLFGELDIPEGVVLYFNGNEEVSTNVRIPAGKTLTVNGGFTLNQSSLRVEGTLNLTGAAFVNNNSYVIVESGGTLNLYNALHVGFYADEFEDYAGVLDICGTLNVIGGYLNVAEHTYKSGGVLNIYDTLNIYPNEDGVGGFLDLSGEAVLGSYSTLNVDINGLNNGGIVVNSCGFLGYDPEDPGEGGGPFITVDDKSVSMVANRGATVECIENSKMIGIYLADNGDELVKAMADAQDDGYAMVQVETTSQSFFVPEDMTVPEGSKLVLRCYNENDYPVLTIPAHVTLTIDGEMDINPGAMLDVKFDGRLVNNGTIYNGGMIRYMDSRSITGEGEIKDNQPFMAGMTLEELQARIDETAAKGETEYWLNEDCVLYGTLELPAGFGLYTSMDGITITVPAGETLNLNGPTEAGTTLNDAVLNVEGTLNVNSPLFVNNGSYVFVGNEGILNVDHSLLIGIHKNVDVIGYGGVVDVCGTLNACGYVFVENTVRNDGALNIYGTMNLVKDTTMEDRYGLLEISGDVVVGSHGVLDLTEITQVGNGGISVNWSGSLILENSADGGFSGKVIAPNKGTVATDAANNPVIEGVLKSYMIGSIYGGENPEELEESLALAAQCVDTYYGVKVNLWDSSITLDRDITVPEGVTLILNNTGDGYYEELLIAEGYKLINNGTIILNAETGLRILEGAELENNGEIILNQWGSMVNYGTISGTNGEDGISGDGDYAEGTMSHAELMAQLEAINTPDSPVGSWIHESITILDPAVNEGVLDISMGTRKSDGVIRAFRIAEYGRIIVPDGCTLIISSPTRLEGGQIIVEDGGKLVMQAELHVGLGTVYLEDGAITEGWEWHRGGPVTNENDEKKSYLSTYWVHNKGEGWFENYEEYGPNHDFRMVPGEEYFWIFYTNVWDAENLMWIRTPVPLNKLKGTENLTIFPMSELDWDAEDKAVRADQTNGNCFAVVRVNDDAQWDSTGKVTAYGQYTHTITIGRDKNFGFYSAPEATDGNWLTRYRYNKFRTENSFYLIFSSENFTLVSAELEDETLATMEPYGDSGKIFKVTLNKDALQIDQEHNDYNGFEVRVNVVANDGQNDHYWDQQVYCEPYIWNIGEGEDMSHADLTYALDSLTNVSDWAGGWIVDGETVLDSGYNGGVLDVNLGIRTDDDYERRLYLYDGGEIVVPAGCELILNSPVHMLGGKITVEEGGKLTVNKTLNIARGTVWLESISDLNNNADIWGELSYPQSNKDGYLSVYWVNYDGEFWYEDIVSGEGRSFLMVPGDEFRVIFYSNVWNDEEKCWERTPLKPNALTGSEYVEVMGWDYENWPVNEEANADCFTAIRVNGGWDTVQTISCDGLTMNIPVERNFDGGFYTAPAATNENWLGSVYAFNPYRDEDAFYFIYTEEKATVVSASLRGADGAYLSKVADNIYKITLSQDARNDLNKGFGIYIDVEYTLEGQTGTQTRTFGQIWCEPLTWNSNIGNPAAHEDLLIVLEYMPEWSGGWVHESTTTLNSDINRGELDTGVMGVRQSDNKTREFFLHEGGEIIVTSGTTLIVHNPLYVQGGKITVQDGGTLHINGLMTITEGGVFVEEGGTVTQGENAELIGQIVSVEEVPEPYLVGRELRNDDDGTGWYESFDDHLSVDYVQGVRTCSDYYVIFYLNEWDAEKQEWVATPVVPTTSDSTLYNVKKLTEDEQELIRKGQPNAEYFVRMEGYGDLHHSDTTITVERDGQEALIFDYNVWGRALSFYTAPEATIENLIRGWNVNLDPVKENVFYVVCNETSWFSIYDWNIRLNTWGEDYNKYVPEGEQFLYIEKLTDANGDYTGVVKFTVNPAYTNYVRYDWKNFQIQVTAYTVNQDNVYESLTEDLWINPPEQDTEELAWIEIDHVGYHIFDGAIFESRPTGEFDPDGNEIHSWNMAELPAGVSYDVQNNILTLNGANLKRVWTSGNDLPSRDLTINLIGENRVINDINEDPAVVLAEGLNVTITGDGSLYSKALGMDCFNLDDGSNLTIEGNAELIAELTGNNPHQSALWGDGGNLTVRENATLTTIIPDNALRFGAELTQDGVELYGIHGFKDFVVMDNATVNTSFYNVPNDGSFTMDGGSVNIEGLDGVWSDGETVEYTNEGIFTQSGVININGGRLNITVEPKPAKGCSTYFHGIATDYGTVNISGGTIAILSSGRGMGIKIAAKYEEDGSLSQTVGGTLNVSGGDLYFNRMSPNDHPMALYVFGQSTADITGGTFHVIEQSFYLQGHSSWNNAVFEGNGASFIADHLSLESGTIHMTNGGYVVFGTENYLIGGTIDLDNSYMEVEGYANIMGNTVVDIDMDINNVVTGEGIENGGYEEFVLRINGKLDIMENAKVNIDINTAEELYASARLNGVQVYGVYQQMGGEVTVSNSNPTCSTMASFGQTYLRDGILNLNGGRTGMVQAFNNDLSDPEEEWSILQVHGGELNINGNPDGILVEGPTEFYGGSINVYAECAAEDREPSAIAVMTTGENSHSYLAIFGGDISLKAYETDAAENEDALEGIGLYAYGAPINIYGGSVEMDADIAMRIDGEKMIDGEGVTFVDAQSNPLSWKSENDSHILVNADGTAAKTAVVKFAGGLAEYLKTNTPDEDGVYRIWNTTLTHQGVLTLKNMNVEFMDGAQLIVKAGAELTIDENSELFARGGIITVENGGKIVNGGCLINDRGVITFMGEDGYVHNPKRDEDGYLIKDAYMNSQFYVENGKLVVSQTTGVPEAYHGLDGQLSTAAQLSQVLAMAGDHCRVTVWTDSSMTLNVTIPENVIVSVDGQDSTAVLTVSKNLINNGNLNLGNATLNVNKGAAFVNNGYVETDIHDAAVINIAGSLTNNSDSNISLGKATMNVTGTYMVNANSSIFVNDGSTLTVDGTMTSYGAVHVGHWKQTAEDAANNDSTYSDLAGKLIINGTVNNYGYMNVSAESENSGGVVEVKGSLNILSDAGRNAWGFLENHGTVTVSGSLKSHQHIANFGSIELGSTAVVTNNGALWLEGDGDASLMADLGAVFTNNGSLRNMCKNGMLDLSKSTFVQGTNAEAEIVHDYFDDGTLSEVLISGIDESEMILCYEGHKLDSLKKAAAYAEEHSYKCYVIRVDANMLVPEGKEITIAEGAALVILEGNTMSVEGSLSNNGKLALTAGANLEISENGVVFNSGELQTSNQNGTAIVNDGLLSNQSTGSMNILGGYSGEGTLENTYSNGKVSVLNGVAVKDQVLTTSVATRQELMDAVAFMQANEYHHYNIYVTGNITINADLSLPEKFSLFVEDGNLTVAQGVVLRHNGELGVNSKLIINGRMVMDEENIVYGKENIVVNGTLAYFLGESLYWQVKDGVLVIEGNGEMPNFGSGTKRAPWTGKAINSVKIGSGVKNIGAYAFYQVAVDSILIPRTIERIGNLAFKSSTVLQVYHGSVAEDYGSNEKIQIHEMAGLTCVYEGCGYSLVIPEEKTVEEKAEAVKEVIQEADTEKIVEELAKDDSSTTTLIQDIETQIQEEKKQTGDELTVSAEVKAEDTTVTTTFNQVSADAIVGAVINAEPEATEVKLVISDAENIKAEEDLSSSYDAESAVTFSMTMEGVEDPENLAVPVKITLPVPDGMDVSRMKLLHYHGDTVEELDFTDNGDGTITFVLTGFSDFVYVYEAEQVVLTATDAEATVGAENVTITVTTGTASIDEALKATYTLTGADGKEIELADALNQAGTYTITPKYTASTAYEVKEVKTATLTVKAAEVTITAKAEPATVTVGAETVAITVTSGDAALDEAMAVGYTITDADDHVVDLSAALSLAGTYTITPKFTSNSNYTVKTVPATLTVVEPEPAGTIKDNGRTLSLDGVIYINQYVLMEGFEGLDRDYFTANGGMLIWSEPLAEEYAVHGYGNPDDNKGLIANALKDGSYEYMARTDGIVVKKYADECYMRVYLKMEDGSYIYGPLKEFSVQDYCEGRLEKSSNEKLKNTCAAMLHFGAAAQTYFNYNTEDLANAAILESYPVYEFDSGLLNEVGTANTGIVQSAKVSNNGRTLSLDGAIVINYYFGVKDFEPVTAKLLFWEGVEGELTPENATASTNLTLVNGEYFAQGMEFAAKEYGNVVYACAEFTDTEGNKHYSDVTGFSPEAYAEGRINKSSNQKLVEMVKRMVTYGEYARIYLAK